MRQRLKRAERLGQRHKHMFLVRIFEAGVQSANGDFHKLYEANVQTVFIQEFAEACPLVECKIREKADSQHEDHAGPQLTYTLAYHFTYLRRGTKTII